MFQIFFLLILFHLPAATVQFCFLGKIGTPEREIWSLYLKNSILMNTLFMTPSPVLIHEKWTVWPWTGSPNPSSHKLAMWPYICHIILVSIRFFIFWKWRCGTSCSPGFFPILHQLITTINKAFPVWLLGITR